jgi:hypothetical protein
MTPQQLAKKYATQAAGQIDLDQVALALLEAVGEIERAEWFDVGPGGAIAVVLPGWRNHGDPRDFIVLAWPR